MKFISIFKFRFLPLFVFLYTAIASGVDSKTWQEPFFFIQMSDCQLGFFEDNQSWEQEKRLLQQSVEHINRLHPKFVILCGDLTHAFPNTPKYQEQVADYKKIVSQVDPTIPLICLCGNHDVGNRPTVETIATYESNFGPNYFNFWVGGVHCIALNSSLISDPSGAPDLYQKQLAWLDQKLAESAENNATHSLIFAHHPWFLKIAEEDNNYFNIPYDRRMLFLEKFSQAHCTACFSGHYHRNAYGKYKDMECITTSALGRPLGDDPSGFRIVHVFEDCIQHAYFALDQVPEMLELDAAPQ